MELNRNNYEEYFLLYLDGELDAAGRNDVEQFLAANPDLAMEMDLLKETILKADAEENVRFGDLELLLKPEPTAMPDHSDMPVEENSGAAVGKISDKTLAGISHEPVEEISAPSIREDNYESYLLSYIDNELSPSGRSEVEAFTSQYAPAREMLELLGQTKLQPDLSIVYPNKEELLRKEEKTRRIVYFRWQYVAAAAALLGVLVTTWLNRPGNSDSAQPGIAITDPKKEKNTGSAPVENTNPAGNENLAVAGGNTGNQAGSHTGGYTTGNNISNGARSNTGNSMGDFAGNQAGNIAGKTGTPVQAEARTGRYNPLPSNTAPGRNQQDLAIQTPPLPETMRPKNITGIQASLATDLQIQTPVAITEKKGDLVPVAPSIKASSKDALTSTLAANENLESPDDDVLLIGNTRINKSSFRGIIRKTGRFLERTANVGENKASQLLNGKSENKKD